jgi:hypothetical protein
VTHRCGGGPRSEARAETVAGSGPAGLYADASAAPILDFAVAPLLFLPVPHRQYCGTGLSVVGDEGVE